MTAYLWWAAELLLECAGAALTIRRSRLLAFILTVSAITDIAAFLVFQFCARAVYAWSYWAQHSIKNLMLCWLACAICGMFVAERNKFQARIATAFLSVGAIALVAAFAFNGETLKERLLDGEIAANGILLGFVVLGWITRKAFLSREWKWITAGFMVMVGGDLAVTILWTFWDGARHWYPLTTIAALLMWAFGPMLPHKLSCVQYGLGVKIEQAEKVSVC